MGLDGFENLGGTAAAELARGGSAQLDKVGGDGFAVVHCVECSDLVNSHLGHIQQLGNSVHDANTGPSLVLSLTQIKNGQSGSLLVLWWVASNDFMRAFEVFGGEFEWN